MSQPFSEQDLADCAEGERCIDRSMTTADVALSDELMNQAYRMLLPLVERRMPHAQYLFACYLYSRESPSEEHQERRRVELIQDAARAGHPQAQFVLGQMYDRGGDLDHNPEISAHWFRLSAEQGNAYAEWVHGLNLLHGEGLPKNIVLGLKFIERAAAKRFEGALQFLADAHTTGYCGYPIDPAKAEYFRGQLQADDVISF